MFKKFMVTTITTAMVMSSIIGCGKAEPETTVTDTTVVEASTEASSEEVKEESTVGYVIPGQEETKEEEVTETDDFVLTEEYAVEKLNKASEALTKALEANKDPENNAIYGMANGFYEIDGIKTKDNIEASDPNHTAIFGGVYSNYFYDYVNNDSGYYDFRDYITSHNYDDISLYDSSSDFARSATINTNNFAMAGCAWLTSIFSDSNITLTVDNITDVISVENKNISVNKNTVPAAFQCSIMMDGEDSGLVVLFDKDGNMLNINDENVKIEFKQTFPDGIVSVEN